MELHPKLLDHPFYQAWTRGEVPRRTLKMYHHSYGEFIRAVPSLWKRVVDSLRPNSLLGAIVIQEEAHHALLWNTWGDHLQPDDCPPHLQNLTDAFRQMSPSHLLGALHAFEVQQPEVARVKKEGLVRHYGIPESALEYFDEHQDEARHIAFGRWLARHFARPEEFAEGFRRGAELVYHSLDVYAPS
jgi:pyrroloquinoline-quinone synthase